MHALTILNFPLAIQVWRLEELIPLGTVGPSGSLLLTTVPSPLWKTLQSFCMQNINMMHFTMLHFIQV
jgi:hypothetical protein